MEFTESITNKHFFIKNQAFSWYFSQKVVGCTGVYVFLDVSTWPYWLKNSVDVLDVNLRSQTT